VENPFSVSSAGAMALVLNQTVKLSTMATERKASMRHRMGCSGVLACCADNIYQGSGLACFALMTIASSSGHHNVFLKYV
jgi:hypothetical protein